MATLTPEAKAIFGKTYAVPDELWLEVFFSPTQTSRAAGQEFLQRLRARTENRDPSINEKVALAQIAALEEWVAPRSEPYAYLKNIKQPVLIVNGSNDVIMYTVNSFILQRNLPNAQLIIYPDSIHGSQYQFPELFVEHVNLFLAGPSIGRSPETSCQAGQRVRRWLEFVGAV
jgi:pimeloyl-ACP methyl ester carboxylesterase